MKAERKPKLGDEFVLKEFHGEFVSEGRIAISLIRYEMTGCDKNVESFWNRQPLDSILMQ